jgi:hypothetical protein
LKNQVSKKQIDTIINSEDVAKLIRIINENAGVQNSL